MPPAVRALARPSPAWARSLPFAIYIAFLAAGSSLAPLLPDGRWLYALQIGSAAVAFALLARHYGELRGSLRDLGTDALPALAVGAGIFVLWINLDQSWALIGSARGFDPRDAAGAIDWPLALVRLFGAAAVVPVMEELFWRAFVMRWIERPDFSALPPQAVGWRALLVTSVLFGVEHTLWLAGIVAGLAYGWLYLRSGKLWAAIVAHGTTNLLLGAWVLYSGSWQFW